MPANLAQPIRAPAYVRRARSAFLHRTLRIARVPLPEHFARQAKRRTAVSVKIWPELA